MKPVRIRRLFIFLAFSLILVSACLLEESTSNTPTPPGPFTLPTPTPLPPTPTPTPLPAMTTGTVIQAMTAKHETLPVQEIDLLLASFLPANNQVPAQYDVDTYRIWFRTRDEDGLVISIQADVRLPRVAETQTFPVFVYGAGTTGIANKCAALNEHFTGRNWGNYRSHMISYATQGYIAILPNWQGYDTRDRTHPYFVSELEGRVMLDAAKAVYDFFEQPPANDILARPDTAIFFGGYSQGGHGAFFASRMASSYAPELDIKGLIGHAMSPDVEGLMYDSPQYSPYIVYAYRDFYGAEVIDPADVFLPNWLSTFQEDVTSKCIDDVFEFYSNDPARMYTNAFREALYNDRLAEAFPLFKEKLDTNDSSHKVYTAVPSILLHGAADPIVQVHTIEAFVSYICGEGKNVTYNLYPGVNHFQTRQHSFADTLLWMQYILDGNTPTSNCPGAAAPQEGT
jgi:dienelactone hydrolase